MNDQKNTARDNEEDGRIPRPYDDIALPASLEDRVVAKLREQNLILAAKAPVRMPWLRVAASILLVAGIFGTGWMAGRGGAQKPPTVEDTRQEYMLLVYNPPGFEAREGQVEEYTQWFREYNSKGYLYSGEELSDEGWIMGNSRPGSTAVENRHVSGEKGYLSGFFTLRASSPGEALRVASSCPHLKFRGALELRPVSH